MFSRTPLVLVLFTISDIVNGRYWRRQEADMDASVLLPLYVYPFEGAWDPVFEMASSYPRVQFTAIVNPQSGPGEGALPDENYTQAISTLNSMDNVCTIGYVATTWCTKNVSSVLDEVAVYAGWGDYDSSLALNGIFFDETPTLYSPEYVSYLQTISRAVRSNRGLRDGFVVQNPGALPEMQYFDDPDFANTADLTIIFENTYANWTVTSDALIDATKSYDHGRLALMLHSTPGLDYSATEHMLQKLLEVGHSMWVTETQDYTKLDSYFSVFVDVLDDLLN